MITMIYYGKGINIPYDTQIFEAKDEITIYQQHCGGENLLVYAGLHQARGTNQDDPFFSYILFSLNHLLHFSRQVYIQIAKTQAVSVQFDYLHQRNI